MWLSITSGIIIKILLMVHNLDYNPSSPRVLGYGRVCPTVPWHLAVVECVPGQRLVYGGAKKIHGLKFP
jgi:hypothetical protein